MKRIVLLISIFLLSLFVNAQRLKYKRLKINKTEWVKYQKLVNESEKHGTYSHFKRINGNYEEIEKGQYVYGTPIGKWKYMHAHRDKIKKYLLHNVDSSFFYQTKLLGYHKVNHQEHLIFKDFHFERTLNGDFLREGFVSDNKKIGLWHTKFENGYSCNQVYRNGLLYGRAFSFYPSGDTCAIRFYYEGKQFGSEIVFYPNGDTLCINHPLNDSMASMHSYFIGNKIHQKAIFIDTKLFSLKSYQNDGEIINQSKVDSFTGNLGIYKLVDNELELVQYGKIKAGKIDGSIYTTNTTSFKTVDLDNHLADGVGITSGNWGEVSPMLFMNITTTRYYYPPKCFGDTAIIDKHFDLNFRMPTEAIEEGVSGSTSINFDVTEDGLIENIKTQDMANFHSGRYLQFQLNITMLKTQNWWAPAQFFGFPDPSKFTYEFLISQY